MDPSLPSQSTSDEHPEVDQESSASAAASTPAPVEVNEDTDISTLSAAQVYDLNQNLLNLSADVHRPLIAQISPISELRAEYENGSPSFVQQIDWLKSQGFTNLRRTRGDGDCFYRSVAFAYVERLLHAEEPALAVAGALSTLESTPQMLESVGFERLVFEDFYEVLETLVKNIVTPDETGKSLDDEALLNTFQSDEISNSVVMYLRMLTSAQIRIDPDTYAPFLFHPELGEPMEVRQFCEHFVDATGKEADHVQMTALCRALQVNVDVAYLDGRGSNGQVEFVKFQPENAENLGASPICLLYRPGHYDILVSTAGEKA